SEVSGNIHFSAPDERAAVQVVKSLLSYLPANNLESPPDVPFESPLIDDDGMDEVVPEDPRKAYDVHDVIARLTDGGTFLEVQSAFGRSVVVGFGRLGGMVVGIVANQPMHLAGSLDMDASDKAARFVRTCNVFNIPLVTLVDVPGFLPGVAQEHGGIIRHGAKMLFAYSAATVPKMTVILRKAYGGAYAIMASKHLRSDLNLSLPTPEIAVTSPEGAVNVIHRREISSAADPAAEKARLVAAYRERFANPYRAAELGYVDEVLKPEQTRARVIRALEMLRTKRQESPPRKHGNPPL
ncbi:MAG TPA: carboxyl transferase domain-containing protein, partial [Thermoanaerobaculia bacterium]|nr:carboxyl transferase domain-containing protein [Thermoanaerobaculia bacterium]